MTRKLFASLGELADFLVVLAVAVAGLVSLALWPVAVIGAAWLFCRGLENYRRLVPRARRVGATGKLYETLALSAVNAVAASGGAFLLGVVVRWMW